MDKNLRDRVEKILRKYCSSSCCFGHEEEATALCSLIEERDRDSRVDELLTLFTQEGWEELEDYIEKRISQLKDQKGEKCTSATPKKLRLSDISATNVAVEDISAKKKVLGNSPNTGSTRQS